MPKKKNISHYRGDTYDATLAIDGYTPVAEDVIKFGIRTDFDAKDYLIYKEIDPLTMKLHLTSQETQDLPETAVYDAQITFTDVNNVEHTKTFICGTFKTGKDVVK